MEIFLLPQLRELPYLCKGLAIKLLTYFPPRKVCRFRIVEIEGNVKRKIYCVKISDLLPNLKQAEARLLAELRF